MLPYKLPALRGIQGGIYVRFDHGLHIICGWSPVFAFKLIKCALEPKLISRYNLAIIFVVWILSPRYKIFRILKRIIQLSSLSFQYMQLMPHLLLVDLIPLFFFIVGVSLLRLGESGSSTGMTLLLGCNALKFFIYWYGFFYINCTMTFEFWHIYVFTLEISYLRKAFFHFFKNVVLMMFVKYIASPHLITEHVHIL